MLKKRLFILGLSTMTVASLLATTAVSANTGGFTGNTDVNYLANTVGPVNPIDPTNPENDENNWMVYYPKSIILHDNNLTATNGTDGATKGKKIKFTVKQIVAGSDGDSAVNQNNIGNGIEIRVSPEEASHWVANGGSGAKNSIKMKLNGAIKDNVLMAVGAGDALVTQDASNPHSTVLTTLTQNTATTNNTYAVLTKADGVKDGETYTAKLRFTFTKKTR